ncbi:MAG: response regulator transcription factor [Ruminiclostridium sp.]|nr:response regulator transcription factor [Ruminiclostridium sp.]
MNKTRVMIVDDQAVPRQLFELYVKSSDRYELAFSVQSAGVADVYLLKNKVDLIIMDILMNDGSDGLETSALIKQKYPDIKIIAVTSMPEGSWLKKAREIGIESFWYKETDQTTLLDVMDRTMNGESVYPDAPPMVKVGNALSTSFSERELDVLRVITTGASNAEVAAKIGISENTVKTYVRSMLEKTGYRSRTELAVKTRVLGFALGRDEKEN